jgi:hypothetical protein
MAASALRVYVRNPDPDARTLNDHIKRIAVKDLRDAAFEGGGMHVDGEE